MSRLSRDDVRIQTKSGIVQANVSRAGDETWIEISQLRGVVEILSKPSDVKRILAVLGISRR